MDRDFPLAVPFIRFARIVNWPPGHTWGPRTLYDHEFVYVIGGSLEATVGNNVVTATADQLLLIPPHIVNDFRTVSQSPHTHIGIHFDWIPREDTNRFRSFHPVEYPVDESLFRPAQCVPGWDSEAYSALDLRGRPRVGQLLHEVVEAYSVSDEYSRAQAGGLLAVAIAQIAREVHLQAAFADHPGIGADAVRRVHRARELLEAPQSALPKVATVAAEVGWSPDHLNRMCRAVLGASPQDIRITARIRRATELLSYTNADLTEIALGCGFCDASHFTRVFKQVVGVTPRDFVGARMKS